MPAAARAIVRAILRFYCSFCDSHNAHTNPSCPLY